MSKMYWLNCTAKQGKEGKQILEKAVKVLQKMDIDAWIEEE